MLAELFDDLLSLAIRKGDVQSLKLLEKCDLGKFEQLQIDIKNISVEIVKGNKNKYEILGNADLGKYIKRTIAKNGPKQVLSLVNNSKEMVRFKIKIYLGEEIAGVRIFAKNAAVFFNKIAIGAVEVTVENADLVCERIKVLKLGINAKNGNCVLCQPEINHCNIKMLNGNLVMEDCKKRDFIVNNQAAGGKKQLNYDIENGEIIWNN